MAPSVCIGASTLNYPHGGGLRWLYLNWALGFAALGCDVFWLEFWTGEFAGNTSQLDDLRASLRPFGLGDQIAVCDWYGGAAPPEIGPSRSLEEVATASDLFVNLGYFPPSISNRFTRRAFVEQDPGLVAGWVAAGVVDIGVHDTYFTIGEHVAREVGLVGERSSDWEHVFQAVSIEHWKPGAEPWEDRAFTTVAHWHAGGAPTHDDKRNSFEPYLGLPPDIEAPMELALDLFPGQPDEVERLRDRGWRVVDAHQVARTLDDFAGYVRTSLAEFSCAKPSYVRLGNAWVSDRTICYLASGLPAVVQHTGPSEYLPDASGILRFRDPAEARRLINVVLTDYDVQCAHARAVAEELFDAKKVAHRILERSIP